MKEERGQTTRQCEGDRQYNEPDNVIIKRDKVRKYMVCGGVCVWVCACLSHSNHQRLNEECSDADLALLTGFDVVRWTRNLQEQETVSPCSSAYIPPTSSLPAMLVAPHAVSNSNRLN